jgi:DNA-binding LacI/PurR family transcriptional regulator
MPLGVLEALFYAGLSVPRQVSVVGFDNMPESAFFRPPLTTLHHDFDLIGQSSYRATIWAGESGHESRKSDNIIQRP